MTLAPLLAVALIGTAAAGAQPGGAPMLSAEEVAGWLHWESGRMCRDLIDACLDGDGNEIVPLPEYEVSNLKCRPMPEETLDCSFTAVMTNAQTPSPSHCTATFRQVRGTTGEVRWMFALHPRERLRLSPDPILKCN